jgi:hypothetical protein
MRPTLAERSTIEDKGVKGPGLAGSALDQIVIECGSLRTMIVAVPGTFSGIYKSRFELVDAGTQPIER